ncbi:MAG: hypothetical protein H8F28_07305 [Fibrella sp.]|nr:hypothetical protein [Armatimonadota bacterium]
MSSYRLYSAIIFLSAFALVLLGDGNAAPPVAPNPAPTAPVTCIHPITATPPTPEQIDPARYPHGSDARRALPLAPSGERWTLYSEKVNHINAWARASDDRVWIATGSGVKCVDEKTNTIRHDTPQGGSGLPTENIIAIATAGNGDVWCFASKTLDSFRCSYYLCHLESGRARWQTIRTFELPIRSDDESLYRPGLLASGRYLAVALPGEDHTPLLLWDGAVWLDLPIPARSPTFGSSQFFHSPPLSVSLVSLDDTHLSIVTPTGFHLLRLPPAGTTRDETMLAPPARSQTILAATPASRPARVESGYWVVVHENAGGEAVAPRDEEESRQIASRWNLFRVLPGGSVATMAPAPQPAPDESDSPPQSVALHATDDGTEVWVAVTYQDNDRIEAQILRFDAVRGTWKVMLTVSPGFPPGRPLEQLEGTPGRTAEDWSGIPIEMAAHLVRVRENFPAASHHAAFTALPTWFCPPQPLPQWSWGDGANIPNIRIGEGDTWSVETRGDGSVLNRTAALGSAVERFAPPPAPRNPLPPIRGLASTPDGKLLVATDLSVQRFTPARKRWEDASGGAADLLGPDTRLLTTADGAVWVAGPQAVARLDTPGRRQVIQGRLTVIGIRPDGGLWLADSTPLVSGAPRLFQVNGEADTPVVVPVAPYPAPQTIDPGTTFFAATGGVVWCSHLLRGDNGRYDYCLLGYDAQVGKWLPPLKLYGSSQGGQPVWRAEDDYYHAVISTPDGDAIFRIAGATGQWERVVLMPDDPVAVSATPAPTTVWQRQARGLTFVSADRRRFWFHQGLGVAWEFDRKHRTWKCHAAPATFFPLRFPLSGVASPTPRESLQRGPILATVILGDTLFAASASGLVAFDRRTHVWRWERLPLGVGGDPRMQPSRLTSAQDSLLVQFFPGVTGHYAGPSVIARLDRKALRWREMWYPGGPLGPGPDGELYGLKHDGRSLWATTDRGVYRLDAKTRRWRSVSAELGAPSLVPLLALGENAVEPGKSVWVARTRRDEQHPTRLPLLSRYDVPRDRWEHFPASPELETGSDAFWLGVYAQEPDAVWLTTGNGPLRFDRKTHQFTRAGPAFENSTNLRYMFVLPDAQGVPIRWFVGSGIALRLAP